MKKATFLTTVVLLFLLTACTMTYDVTFYIEEGDEVVVSVNEGETVTPPSDPEDEGWEFLGWFADPELNTAFNFDTEISDNITIYAGWEYLYTPLNGVVQTVMDSIPAGYTKWYKVTLEEEMSLNIYTTGNIDTYGYILDMEEETLYEDDSSFADGLNFQFYETLPAGSYYIVVEGFYDTTEGDFTLEIREMPETTNIDTIQDTVVAAQGMEYEITIVDAGTYHFFTTGDTDTYGYLMDGFLTILLEDDDRGTGSNCYIISYLEPGTYFFQVEGFDEETVGDYTFYMEIETE